MSRTAKLIMNVFYNDIMCFFNKDMFLRWVQLFFLPILARPIRYFRMVLFATATQIENILNPRKI